MDIVLMKVSVIRWLMVTPLIVGCSRSQTIEFVNTSGRAQAIEIVDDRDVLLVDTVAQGAVRCWQVPEVARGRLLYVAAGDTGARVMVSAYYLETWSDSLKADRSWVIRLHVPRFVDASEEWKAADRRQQVLNAAIIERKNTIYSKGGMTAKELDNEQAAFRAGIPREPGAPRFVPVAELEPSSPCRAGSKGGR